MELSFPTSDQYFVRYVMLKSDCKKKPRVSRTRSYPIIKQNRKKKMRTIVMFSNLKSSASGKWQSLLMARCADHR